MQFNIRLDVISIGYAMSATLFCIALALTARAMHSASGFEEVGWIGLATITMPLGMSFISFLVTEVIRVLNSIVLVSDPDQVLSDSPGN